MDLRRPLVLSPAGLTRALLRVILALGGEPVVLHVDHGLRGEGSREDADSSATSAGGWSTCEVRQIGIEDDSNLQERAREDRYRLAEEVAVGLGCSCSDGPPPTTWPRPCS